MFKKFLKAINKIEGVLKKIPLPFGMVITAETDFSGGNYDEEGRKILYYCEITPSTGALVADHRFGKLPFALESTFIFDPKEEPLYNCEKTVETLKRGNLEASIGIKCKTNSKIFEDFITKDSVGKEYAVLFSTGKDALENSTYFQEQMRLAPRGVFKRAVNIKTPDGKTPDMVFNIMRPVATFTLDCGDGGSPEALNTVLPTTIATEWGLDSTELLTKVFTVNPQEREYDLILCKKTF